MELGRDHIFNPFNPSPEHQAILDSVPDLDHDDVDFSDPATIAGLSGMPAPPTMEPSAWQKRAHDLTTDIFKDHDLLQKIHESRLRLMRPVNVAVSWHAAGSQPWGVCRIQYIAMSSLFRNGG